MTNPDPYKAPDTTGESTPSSVDPQNRMLRPGVTKLLAVAWNLPIVAFIALCFTGHVSFDDFPKFILLLCAAIPFACLAVAFVPLVQRFLFVPGFDVPRIRPMLFASAALWIAITFGMWWSGV